MEVKTVRRYEVEGPGEFPLDMLWVDAAYPHGGAVAQEIRHNIVDESYSRSDVVRRFALVTADWAAPFVEEWEKRGWRVLP